jgi:hypothetical protein
MLLLHMLATCLLLLHERLSHLTFRIYWLNLPNPPPMESNRKMEEEAEEVQRLCLSEGGVRAPLSTAGGLLRLKDTTHRLDV